MNHIARLGACPTKKQIADARKRLSVHSEQAPALPLAPGRGALGKALIARSTIVNVPQPQAGKGVQ